MTTDPDSGRRLEAIVLAAGSGARFGGGKLSAPFQGRVLIEGALACAFAAPARSVFLTVGGDPDAVSAADRFAEQIGGRARLRIVDVADHAEGMGASLRAAARALPEDADGVFVFLGDMPFVPVPILASLAAALAAGALAAAPICGGRRGHPALFSAALVPRLASLEGDAGARAILADIGAELSLVETEDEGVLLDIDSPADLQRLAGRSMV